jgi:hypothetical protein
MKRNPGSRAPQIHRPGLRHRALRADLLAPSGLRIWICDLGDLRIEGGSAEALRAQ